MPKTSQELYTFEHPPLLIVIAGTSGSGKDSVVKALVKRLESSEHPVHFVITATSRSMREDEVHGVDYYFVTKEEFERMIAHGELLEYATVYGQYKGVPKEQVQQAMDCGKDVIMRLDVQGASTIRQLAPEALLIFLTAPSEQDLIDRLRGRKTEDPEQLKLRLETAYAEMQRIDEFDYVVPNATGKLDQTVDIIQAIITAEKHRTNPRRARL